MVCVMVLLWFGEDTFVFDVTDGRNLVIEYEWPDMMSNVKDLLNDDGENIAPKDHPMFKALERALERVPKNDKGKPFGRIMLTLPQEVKQDATFWKKEIVKSKDGSVVALLTFECP